MGGIYNIGLGGAKQYNFSQLMTTSGTFTVPAGVTRIRVKRVGGGAAANTGQLGGGNGYYIETEETVTPGQVLTVGIGAGGAYNGGSGGDTTITGMVPARGGLPMLSGGAPVGGTGWGIYGIGGYSNGAGVAGAALFEW